MQQLTITKEQFNKVYPLLRGVVFYRAVAFGCYQIKPALKKDYQYVLDVVRSKGIELA